MVAPRAHGIKIRLKLGVVQFGGDVFARQFGLPMHVQPLRQDQADAHRVDAGPWLGAIVQQPELGRQRVGVLGDEEVDAVGVVVEAGTVDRGLVGVDALGRATKLKDALGLVVR
jgi:hypothetical protein